MRAAPWPGRTTPRGASAISSRTEHDCMRSPRDRLTPFPDGWAEAFKAGTPPNPDVAANPSKEELLRELTAVHERISAALPTLDAGQLEAEHPHEGARQYFPTVGDHLMYSMTAHEMDHLGQLAAWRRALGLEPAIRDDDASRADPTVALAGRPRDPGSVWPGRRTGPDPGPRRPLHAGERELGVVSDRQGSGGPGEARRSRRGSTHSPTRGRPRTSTRGST